MDAQAPSAAGSDACQPHKTLAEAEPGSSLGLSSGLGALAITKGTKRQGNRSQRPQAGLEPMGLQRAKRLSREGDSWRAD